MSGSAERLFDPGLQPERTDLAWKRTAISLTVGSLVALRVLPAVKSAWWAFLPGLGGLTLAVVLLVASELRYRRVHRALTRDIPARIGDGRLPGATTAGTVLLGLLALIALAICAMNG